MACHLPESMSRYPSACASSRRVFARIHKNLAKAIPDDEIFPRLQRHGDNLQLIGTGFVFRLWIIAFMDSRDQARITIRQNLDPGFARP